MGISMWKNMRRVSSAAALTAAALLTLPGAAGADEHAPVVAGDCASLVDEHGQPVEVDAGALLGAENRIDAGLASGADSLLTVPVDALTGPLGDVPIVGDTVRLTCETGRSAVNTLAAPVQDVVAALPIVGENPDEPDAPEQPEQPEEPAPEPEPEPSPQPEPAPAPEGPDANEPAPGVPAPEEAPAGAGTETADTAGPEQQQLDAALLPPVAAPIQAPDLNADQPKVPSVHSQEAGTAQAMPESGTPNRLPQLLAVLALGAVVIALTRSWVRRKAA